MTTETFLPGYVYPALEQFFLRADMEWNPMTDYFKITNDMQDALSRIRIPGIARQVFDAIIRQTFGYSATSANITMSQLVLATGLSKSSVCKGRQVLIDMRIISITQKGNNNSVNYCINTNYNSWNPLPKKETFPKKETLLPKKETTVTQKGNASLMYKDNIKDNIKDKKILLVSQARDVLQYFNQVTGKHFTNHDPILARLRDGGTVEQCKQIIDTKRRDPHFKNNPKYLCPTTLFRPSHWDKYLNERPEDYRNESQPQRNDARFDRVAPAPGKYDGIGVSVDSVRK